jgi:predicted permease
VAATVVSSLVGVLSNETRFEGENRLFVIGLRYAAAGEPLGSNVTWQRGAADIDAWEKSPSIVALARYSSRSGVVEGAGGPEYREGAVASSSLLQVLRVRPLEGRWFDPGESQTPRVVIDRRLWRSQFSEDPAVIGRTLLINGEPHTVIGVVETGRMVPGTAEFWTPMDRGDGEVLVRARTGVTSAQLGAELNASSTSVRNLRRAHYQAAIVAEPLHDHLFGSAQGLLTLLTVASILLLLVTVANVVNLTLARLLKQEREYAVRAALGAGRSVLATMLGAEALAVCVCAGVLGGLLSQMTTRALARAVPRELQPLGTLTGDTAAIWLVALGAAVVAATLYAPAPMVALVNRRWASPAVLGTARGSASPSFLRARRWLMAAQLCLATLLLISAEIVIRSVSHMSTSARLGFDARNVVLTSVRLFGSKYDDPVIARDFTSAVVERMRALPGATSVAIGPAPLVAGRGATVTEGFSSIFTYRDVSRPETPAANVWVKPVSERYIETYGLQMVGGRDFDQTDDMAGAPVAILNASAAELFFHGSDALGKILPVTMGADRATPRVVGVIKDALQRDPTIDAVPEVLVPLRQAPLGRTITIAVRSTVSSSAVKAALQSTIRALDPRLSASRLSAMSDIVSSALARQRFTRQLLAVLAAIATLMSAVGVYGMISYIVAERIGEFGIRSALGASGRQIVLEVLRDAGRLTAAGVAAGAVSGLLVTLVISSRIAGIDATDGLAFITGPAILIAVALLAAYRPAARAARADPVTALRAE